MNDTETAASPGPVRTVTSNRESFAKPPSAKRSKAKRGRGQPPTKPAVTQRPADEPGRATTQPTSDWADHSNEHLPILQAEIPWALEDAFGIPRGLVSANFLEQAKKTLSRHYPRLRKSAVHRAMERTVADLPAFFVHVPDWAKKRFDRTIRLCDLLETMVHDGNADG